jgi:hypothetical protein
MAITQTARIQWREDSNADKFAAIEAAPGLKAAFGGIAGGRRLLFVRPNRARCIGAAEHAIVGHFLHAFRKQKRLAC